MEGKARETIVLIGGLFPIRDEFSGRAEGHGHHGCPSCMMEDWRGA